MESVATHHRRLTPLRQACVLAGMLFAISSLVLAQVGTSGINGFVTDANGGRIPAATITLTNRTIGLNRTTETNVQGSYSFTALPAGTYSIQAEATGFGTVREDNVLLEPGIVKGINFTLKPAEVGGQVTITSDSTTAVVSSTAESGLFSNIPTARSVTGLYSLAPGSTALATNGINVGNASINGGPASQNRYVIEGSDTTNARVGGGTLFPAADALRSVQVVQGNFSADMARSGGNLLNISVRSGTNDFHGQASFYFRDDSLQARGPFGGNSKPAFGSQRFGGSLSGPIKKDVAFFFVAFDRNRDNEVTTSGRRDIVQRRIVPAFARIPFRSTDFTGRFDLNLSLNDSVSARYSLADGHGVTNGVSQSGRLQDESNFQSHSERQQQVTSSWSHTFNARLSNLALFNFLTSRSASTPASTAPQIVFPSLNVGANFRADQTTLERRIQLKDDFLWTTNYHTFRFGADYNHIALPQGNSLNLFGPGTVFVPCDFAGEPGCPTATRDADIPILFSLINRQNLVSGPAPFGTRGIIPPISDNLFGIYLQDDYQHGRKLTLNFGLRWDYDQDFNGRNQTNQARPGQRKSRKKDLQPRLGIVVLIGKILLRGGYGISFQQNFLQTRQLELLADGARLPLLRFFGGTLSNPFGTPITSPDIFVTSNDLKERYAHDFSLQSEGYFTKYFKLSGALIIRRSRNAPLRVEVNRKQDGSRINNQFGSVLETQSIGRSSYDGLSINLDRTEGSGFSFIKHYQLYVSYTLSKTTDQANKLISYLSEVSNPSNPGLDRGLWSFDARHRLAMSGVFNLPRGIMVAPTFNTYSSLPFEIIQNHDFSEGAASGFYRLPGLEKNAGNRTIRTGSDVNRAIDAFNSNPALVLAHGGAIAHVDPSVRLSRPYSSLSLRVSKRFTFGEGKWVELGADVFNVFNHTNVLGAWAANASGLQNNVESPNFGRPLGITPGGVFDPGAPRAAQLVAKFIF